eukprot:SAG11_NODE_20003_length_454_cov_1.729577_1_plen_74_part_10
MPAQLRTGCDLAKYSTPGIKFELSVYIDDLNWDLKLLPVKLAIELSHQPLFADLQEAHEAQHARSLTQRAAARA